MFQKNIAWALPFVAIVASVIIFACSSSDEDPDYVPTTDASTNVLEGIPVEGGEVCGYIKGKFYRCDETNDWLCFNDYADSDTGICTRVCNLEDPRCEEDEICLDIDLKLKLCSETNWTEESDDAKDCVNYPHAGVCFDALKVADGEPCGPAQKCPENEPDCGTEITRVCESDGFVCIDLSDNSSEESVQGVCMNKCVPTGLSPADGEDWWKSEDCEADERCVPLNENEGGACVAKEWHTALRGESCSETICNPGENLICVATYHGTDKFCLETCEIDGEECLMDGQCTCLEDEVCHPFTGTDGAGEPVSIDACIPKEQLPTTDDDDDNDTTDDDDDLENLCGYYPKVVCPAACANLAVCEDINTADCESECMTGWNEEKMQWITEKCDYYVCLKNAMEDCDAQAACK